VAAAAAREVRVRPVVAAIVAAAWLALGVGLGGGTVPVAVQAVTSAGALLAPIAPAALVVGAVAIAPANLPALGLRAGWRLPEADCLAVQRGAVRLYTVEPSDDQLRWAAADAVRRQVSLGLGYSGLLDGRSIARSFAPVQARALADHLGHADRGPAQRWWLDALGADALVAHHLVPGLEETCRRGELRVLANPAAWPMVAVLAELPAPGTAPRVAGDVLVVERRDDEIMARVRVDGAAGVVSMLLTPDPGWRYRVDGRATSAVVGAGIVHGVPVPGGEHEVRASYHPPLLAPGLALSLASVVAASVFAVGAARRARTTRGRTP